MTYSALYDFQGGTSDGTGPNSTLVSDSSGALYGTTYGAFGRRQSGGTVFKLTPSGGGYVESVIYNFTTPSQGYDPQGVVVDSKGNIYGINNAGGSGQGTNCEGGCGTVFKLTPQSGGSYAEQILYSFQGGTDGAYPYGSLVIDGSGALYGTTDWGGGSSCEISHTVVGCGTVFKLSPSGSEYSYSMLYSFQNASSDGHFPLAGLLLTSGGTLLGTVSNGGAYGEGAAFALSPS